MPKFTAARGDYTFEDAEGVSIHYYVWRAGTPKGVVQIVHGVGEYATRYEDLAQALVAAGYTVYAGDLRGRMRWFGLYTQRAQGIPGGKTAVLEPEELEDSYFMMRVRIDGGQLSSDALRVSSRKLAVLSLRSSVRNGKECR